MVVAGVAIRVTSLRRCQKLLLCPTGPMPAGFQIGPLLAKAEPISHSSSISGITELRKEEKPAQQRSEDMGEKQPCRHQDHRRKRKRCSGARADSPAAHGEAAVPL